MCLKLLQPVKQALDAGPTSLNRTDQALGPLLDDSEIDRTEVALSEYMTSEELAALVQRIAEARYSFGTDPFYPFAPDDFHRLMPFPYLTNEEVLLMGALIEATAKAKGRPDSDKTLDR